MFLPMPRSFAPISVIPMLEIRALSVNYGPHRVLDNVSLDVTPGEIVVILGANGAGKTTLLKTIGGFSRSGARQYARQYLVGKMNNS